MCQLRSTSMGNPPGSMTETMRYGLVSTQLGSKTLPDSPLCLSATLWHLPRRCTDLGVDYIPLYKIYNVILIFVTVIKDLIKSAFIYIYIYI